MEQYGILSVLPPVLAIIFAIKTRQVFVSLLLGIWAGKIIINNGNIFLALFDTVKSLVDVFKDSGNTSTIMFSCLVGALIVLMQRSGGVEGFVNRIQNILTGRKKSSGPDQKKLIQLFAVFTGALVFVESNISVLTVGTVFRPLFDKLKISREKLAYIADSVSSPVCILIPMNAWGALIISLLAAQDLGNPLEILTGALIFNLYPLFALLIIFIILFSKKDFGPMRKAEYRVNIEKKILPAGAKLLIDTEITSISKKKNITARSRNMILPISVMVLFMPVMLIYSGWHNVENISQFSFLDQCINAVGQGSGSISVLYSVLAALLFSAALYKFQRILSFKELMDLSFKGISGLMPLALLMMLAFAIGALCRELGTGIYLSEISRNWLSPNWLPALIFILSCVISFSTGTSFGTYAIMIAIAIPMAQAIGANMYIVLAAVMGGGVFGDHCSPISDTTIITSMASACDHIDHVKTQLPYALTAGVAALIGYIIIGYLI